MREICIVYNDPVPGKLSDLGESGAVLSVLEAVSNVRKALETLGFEVQTLPLRSPMSLAETELAKLNNNTSPNGQLLSPETIADFKFNFPCIVKPVGEHASHGISKDSVVKNTESLRQQIEFIYNSYFYPSLVEEFISGREFSVLVMGNKDPQVFPIEEIIYTLPSFRPHILTYSAKWVPGDEYFIHTQIKCPAELTPELLKQIADIAIRAFKVFGCRGYARVDMRQAENGELLVLEVNPNPLGIFLTQQGYFQ